MARHAARREGLDDQHASAATRGGIRRVVFCCNAVGWQLPHCRRRWRGRSDQLAGVRQFLGLGATARQQAVVADAVKAFGKTWSMKRRMNSPGASVMVLERPGPLIR